MKLFKSVKDQFYVKTFTNIENKPSKFKYINFSYYNSKHQSTNCSL